MRSRARWFGASIVVACACSSVYGEDEGASPPPVRDAGDDAFGGDGQGDGQGVVDTPDVADASSRRCTVDDPFGAPTEIPNLAATLGEVTSIRLSADGTRAFVSARPAAGVSYGIYEGPYPPTANAPYVAVLGGPGNHLSPAPTPSTLTMFFQYPGDGGARIARARRAQVGQVFSGVIEEVLPSFAATTFVTPWLVAGREDVLYYSASTVDLDLWRAHYDGGAWSGAAQRATSFAESYPVVTQDELVIYFRRSSGSESGDVYYATRTAAEVAWGPSLALDAVNSTADDRPTWISENGCTLLLTSNRTGSYRAYRADR